MYNAPSPQKKPGSHSDCRFSTWQSSSSISLALLFWRRDDSGFTHMLGTNEIMESHALPS